MGERVGGRAAGLKPHTCGRCGQLLDIAHLTCPRCGAPLGYALPLDAVLVLDSPEGDGWVRCAEHPTTGCPWLIRPDDGPRCEADRLIRTVPGGDDPDDHANLLVVQDALRRLVVQLTALGLPIVDRAQDPEQGLAFDLKSTRFEPVTTGHADGVITIDLAEGDDAHREMLRAQLDEPYRTVLGHLRHEIGHYYWGVLVDRPGRHESFRDLFGDERTSYQDALERHYADGAEPGWHQGWVSAYATMHPWEDWAETFAHLLHIRDTLDTAAAFGMTVAEVTPTGDVDDETFWAVARDWSALAAALNAVNRAMGHADLYPFDLAPAVIAKLAYVHDLVRGAEPS